MAGGARLRMRWIRLLGVAFALAPLPLAAATFSDGAVEARGLPRVAVSARDGDLWVGRDRITATRAEDAEPDWSPDRRRIAFVRQEPDARSSSLYVVRRDGGDLRRLTTGDRVVAMPAWSPDGKRIAFASSPLAGGSFDIWLVDAEGGGLRRVTKGAGEEILPSWTLAGKLEFERLQPGEPWPVKTSDAGTPQTGPRELLPDFDQRAPFRLTVAGTKLGFSSATDNVGEGPIWIRGFRISAGMPMRAQQLIRLSNGSTRIYEDAGRLRYTPSPTHTHWHVLDFQRYELLRADGTLVVRDRKSGFCLADHYGLAARRVAAFRGPRFLGNCAAFQPGALTVEQGSSPGYTDLYPAHFHGQNLELRGVPAGVYVLVHRANAKGLLEELDYGNNAASIRIRLTWSGSFPRVRTLRVCQDSPRC
jgi:hypothetical protein